MVGFLVLGLIVPTNYVSSEISLKLSTDSKTSNTIPITPTAPKLIQVNHSLSENAKDKIDTTKLALVSLPFIENQGQIDSQVKFYAKTFGGTVFVTDSSLTYSFPEKNSTSKQNQGLAVKEQFISGNGLKSSGLDKSSSSVNYFVGDKKNWHSDISTYNSVSLGQVWPLIDVTLHAYGNNVEKIFLVNPGANPDEIKLAFDGINSLSVDKDGKLVLDTDLGPISMTKPVAYQEINGERRLVDVSYWVIGNKYGFTVGDYDHNYSLYIDPLLASTIFGGLQGETIYGITLDSSGNVYVAGTTYSFGFPTTVGAYDQTFNGDLSGSGQAPDIFISKLNSNLTTLLASTFIGGNDNEARAIALDSSGNVYITGKIGSSDYPTTAGAYDRTLSGSYNVFISKLDSSLHTLQASTFLGGGYDATALALDSSGNVYVTGITYSPDFPTTSGAYDRTPSLSGFHIFISKLDPTLTTLLASTFLGHGDYYYSYPYAITVDSSGNVYVAGNFHVDTNTWIPDFPTTVGAYDQTLNGVDDAFISKLDSSLHTLQASTFLGGSDRPANNNRNDVVYAIKLDSSGNVFVTGITYSPDFPTTAGAYDQTLNGTAAAFISKLDSSLHTLQASTYLDGAIAHAITVDSSGNVYVGGEGGGIYFPTTAGAYSSPRGGTAIISKFSSDLALKPTVPTTIPTNTIISENPPSITSGNPVTFTATVADASVGSATLKTLKVQSTTSQSVMTSTDIKESSIITPFPISSLSTVPNTNVNLPTRINSERSLEIHVINETGPVFKTSSIHATLTPALGLFSNGTKIASSGIVAKSAVVFIVNSNDDVVDGHGCDLTHCSLREAINAANANPASFIRFSGPLHIVVTTDLPTIDSPVIIDGTQPSSGDTPTVELTGSPSAFFGLEIDGGFSTVKGMVINNFQVGIDLKSSGNFITGNYIGTDVTGKLPLGNYNGIQIVNAPDNTIGGKLPGDRNILSGNTQGGVVIAYPASKNNKVLGNYIGTDVTGTGPLGNKLCGLDILGAPNNIIGGTIPGERNIISGNEECGVIIAYSPAKGNLIEGNYIGTDVTGTGPLGNKYSGVDISDGASGNTIGGKTPDTRNVISGNVQAGVIIFDHTSTGNMIKGNYIGTDVTGKKSLEPKVHLYSGVEINGSPFNIVGGNTNGERNILSSMGSGVYIHENTAVSNQVTGNYIGTDVDGLPSLGNNLSGVSIYDAPNNIVGLSDGISPGPGADCTGACNIISGNFGNGVTVVGALATHNSIRFNSIYDNSQLPIDLGNDGVTSNDPADSDTGPNDLMNFPKILKKVYDSTNTIVSGTIISLPSEQPITIDIYSSDKPGGKQHYVTSVTPKSDGSFTKTIPGLLPIVSATATNIQGSTSEFRTDGDVILFSFTTTQGIESKVDVPVTFVKDKPTVFKAIINNTFDSDKDVFVSITDNSVPVVGEFIHILKDCTATFYFPANMGPKPNSLDFTCDGKTFTSKPLNAIFFKTVGPHKIDFSLQPFDNIVADDSNLVKSNVNQVTETNPIIVLSVPIYQKGHKYNGDNNMNIPCDSFYSTPQYDIHCPLREEVISAANFMSHTFPVAKLSYVQLPRITNDHDTNLTDASIPLLFADLKKIRDNWIFSHFATERVLIFGWLPQNTINNGEGYPGTFVAYGDEHINGLIESFKHPNFGDMSMNNLLLAHELGHSLSLPGLPHPLDDIIPPKPAKPYCPPAPPFNPPYSGFDIGATGYNIYTGIEKPPGMHEFMTGGHCVTLGEEKWVSPEGWNEMIKLLSNIGVSSLASITSSEKSISISGIISANGSKGKLNPIFDTQVQPDSTEGPFTLEMLDSIGSVLHTQNFDVSKTETVAPAPSSSQNEFYLNTIIPTGTAKIQIRNGATILDSVTVSVHAPQVQVIFPNGGETLAGNQTVRWTSSDLDGGTLTHDIQYSFDNGVTWNYLAFGITANSYVFDFDTIPGKGKTALIKVTASDGVNTNSDISDGTFFVANKPPLVGIQNPLNDTVFSPTDNVRLEGEAADIEDGYAPQDSSFVWTIDNGKILGNGRNLLVGPLASGPHKITLTVSDSDGNKVSAVTNILVTGTVIPVDTTTPIVIPPPDQKVIATGPSGALVNYPGALATDDIGVTSGPTCTPSSGTVFPLGATIVTCTAADAANNIGTATFNVIVVPQPPTGTISWSDGGAGGTFSNSGSCTLDSSSCTITYTPSTTSHVTVTPLSVGPVTITAIYSGDSIYDTSSGNSILPVASTPAPSDTTPPIVTGTPDRSANAISWYNATVIITWTGTDNEPGGTGIDSCDTPTSYSGPDGNSIIVTGHCTDKAGNIGTGTVTINYDSTPPTITGAPTTTPNANNWFNSNVDVKFTCTDATSLPVQSFFDLFVTLDGASQSETGTCDDNAGNSASLTVSGINLDKTPPVVTPPPDQKGTATSPSGVTVNYPAATGTDNIQVTSGPTCAPSSGSAFPIGTTLVTCTATDAAGNTGSATFNVIVTKQSPRDTTPPEAFNQFDPVTKTVQVFGRDNSFGTSGPLTPTSVTLDKDNGQNDKNKNDKDKTELRTYQVTDPSGNSIILVEKVKKAGDEIDVHMISVQYNNRKVINFEENDKHFEWAVDKKGAITELEQHMTIGHDIKRQDVDAKFDSKKNKTVITEEKPKSKTSYPGLVLLRMATQNGNIIVEH